ncbi:uncharacterized protein LOC108905692 [Anoplophora glabripennis]|uniref:uncharacterized protein LOC108905692 n=1 Tax=Anoplophora glabripennis TaxID=217634 RepID=UPI000C767621|nr:uncharacterized protein LOC108905692 [Anoplophora glabripennis]
MVVKDSEADMHRKALRDRVIKEGLELWNRQKEFERIKKLKEQREIREMLDSYWPWGRGMDSKPRGLRNLRLEELFPNKDYEKAKRFVGTLDSGRGGGGAPMFNSGKKVTRTREDPILRFQFGSKDLRRCVDNTLRYKTSRENQMEYKKELDKLVEEKKLKEQKEKADTKLFHQEQFLKPPPWGARGPGGMPWRNPNAIGLNFFKSLGWSDHDTMRSIEEDVKQDKLQDPQTYENSKKIKVMPANKVKIDPIVFHKKNFIPVGKNRKLSPLSNNKDQGVELVNLLAKNRNYPPRIPLSSTDVTADQNITGKSSIWSREGSSYLKELTKQMHSKQEKLKEQKEKEIEFVRRHFSTWDAFWGRPGHGAPLPELKKQSLNRLLYPQMFPVGVH